MCEQCHDGKSGIAITETTIYTLQYIVSSPMQKLYTFTVGETVLKELGMVVERYFDAHTDRTFRSLSVLE